MIHKTDLCRYVDVFYGSGETDRFFDSGLASKWFYIKALSGNTIPHATLPFGKMSVGAYSGGYPTGYGTHFPNCCGGIRKLGNVHTVRGFSHLHQSGTGGIRYYYNYAITTPFYGDALRAIETYLPLEDERAVPGYYSARLGDISCELTVDGGVALHRYTFAQEGGRVAVDFSNDGLARCFGEGYFAKVEQPRLTLLSDSAVSFSGIFSGVELHFYAKLEDSLSPSRLFLADGETEQGCACDMEAPYGAVFVPKGRTAILRVGYSTVSPARAREEVEGSLLSFDEAAKRAYDIWNAHLCAIRIDADDACKRKLYSNLYHSLIKPCDLTGESVLGVSGDVVTDLATLWDQYKTTLPLIYLCYPDMRERIARGIINISRTLGKICCSFGLTTILPCEEQAKMLGVITLCDAHEMGAQAASAESIEECIRRELAREDYRPLWERGVFERYTHILDVTDAALAASRIVRDDELRGRLGEISRLWRNAYDDDGLMSRRSPYYEGDRYTYSFRLQGNMEQRIELAGGKDAFCRMLDRFFGFEGESVKQLTYIGADGEIGRCRHHRFEGFNNECDMETPYAYIYAGRHDRLCQILHECQTRSFGLGRHALPGNNDSGGLSSLFVWNAIGIFPASGRGELLIGSPCIREGEISLASGKTLTVRVRRANEGEIYVARALWNGCTLEGYRIPMRTLMEGGTLEIEMTDKASDF